MADFTPTKSPKRESSKASGGIGAAPSSGETMRPPTVYLEDHHLGKLGIKEMPPVGTKLKFHAVAHVGATSENQDKGDGGKRRSMTLHIHKMEMGTEGIDGAKEESQKAGMKSEIDKALKREAGGDGKNAEGEED